MSGAMGYSQALNPVGLSRQFQSVFPFIIKLLQEFEERTESLSSFLLHCSLGFQSTVFVRGARKGNTFTFSTKILVLKKTTNPFLISLEVKYTSFGYEKIEGLGAESQK